MTGDVRWGFLGAGGIARTALAPAVHAASGAVLQAVAARDAGRAAALEPAGRAYPSYDALLADDTVDAVYISLPNDVHAQWSVAALAAGKHVLCEKPLAMTAAQVDVMATAAERAGRLLVEASWYRWHPRVRLAQRLLAEGAVGAVSHVAAGFVFAGELEGNYRLEPGRGGGALYDVGCYAVSAAQWAFDGAAVVDVVARQDLGPTGVDLATEAVLTFGSGEAEVRAGIAEPPRQWLVIRGDAGELELPGSAFTSWQEPSELAVSDGRTTRRLGVEPADAYRTMVEELSSVVRDGPGWVLPVAESRTTAAVIDAAFASADSGGAPVEVTGPGST